MVSWYLKMAYRSWIARPKFVLPSLLILLLGVFGAPRDVYAYANYEVGHITRVSYTTYGVLIMMDGGLPDNCAGTPDGWMLVGSSYTGMIAFITGLWMRGDASQVTVTAYTGGVDSTTFCEIGQIDTAGNGD